MKNSKNQKQKSPNTPQNNFFLIAGLNCDSCAKMIEINLEEEGIKAVCDYANSRLEIKTTNVSFERIKKVVERSGYKLK